MTDGKHLEKQVYRVVIDAPIETVWSELVNTAKPRPFFWNGSWDADFTPDSPYRITMNGGKSVAVIGRVLEMEPPHKLVTTFRLTGMQEPASKVTYLLAEKDGGTEFQLITENILAGSKSEGAMQGGAKFIVENFKAYMETGKVTFGARMTLAIYALMAPITPKTMSAENWPPEKAE